MTKEEDAMFSMMKASVAQLILRRAMKKARKMMQSNLGGEDKWNNAQRVLTSWKIKQAVKRFAEKQRILMEMYDEKKASEHEKRNGLNNRKER